jgi:hypothetical protein
MFISIDLDNLVFLHKHADHDTVSGISFLEAADRSIMVERVTRPEFLNRLSYLDLQMLYTNTVGRQPATKAEPGVLREHLQRIAWSLPPSVAFPEEVAAQVAAVEPELHKGTRYSYVIGSHVPAQARELFPLTKPLGWETVLVPVEDKVVPYPPQMMGRAYTSETPDDKPASVEPREPRAPKAAGGSVRPVVRAAADAAWEQAGKPTDEVALKALTKALIPDLEAQGYHPTTIRIKLSEWVREHKS